MAAPSSAGVGDVSEERRLATVELLGALTYGQLRAFETTARAIRHAPDARTMDRLAGFAVREHAGYTRLRDHLIGFTDLGGPVMDRQKALFDTVFDMAPVDDWLGACTFLATGLPLAADFVRAVAPALDEETATVLVDALADRNAFERFAVDRVVELTRDDREALDRTRALVSDLFGKVLTAFQASIADTDALEVLLGDDQGDGVKRVALEVVEGHRRRMHALGLEDLV